MTDDDNNSLNVWKHFAGVFRFGRGLLGRSAIALVALLALGFAAIWKLHSDILIVAIFVIAAAIFLIWYFRVERFANKNPLEALLEGGDYTAHHQMLLAAKAFPQGVTDPVLSAPIVGAMTPKPIPNDGEQKS
jgi:hypothetical protein